MNARRIYIVLGGATLLLFAFLMVQAQGTPGNTAGWAWGGSTDESYPAGTPPALNDPIRATGIGWVSLSSQNPLPAGYAPGATYNVTVPTGDGLLSGRAWVSNVGYIDFAPSAPYPAAPAYNVKRVSNHLEGWARFLSIKTALADTSNNPAGNSGGDTGSPWQGWIKFGTSNLYQSTLNGQQITGVEIFPGPPNSGLEELRGYAWSNELGWIRFGAMPGDGNNSRIDHGGGGNGGNGDGGSGGGGTGNCATSPCTTPPGPIPLSCSPTSQIVALNPPGNNVASLSAYGGIPAGYTWSALGATPSTSSGTGASFHPAYTTLGIYPVTLNDGNANVTCNVHVQQTRFSEVSP